MTELRDNKVNENVKIVQDTETLVVKTIRDARTKITGIKFNMGIMKFKDGPHLEDKDYKVPDFHFP
jgi:hypothetical protein